MNKTITIVIPASVQTQARELTGRPIYETTEEEVEGEMVQTQTQVGVEPSGLFVVQYSNDGENATHYVSSGNFLDEELNILLNADIEKTVYVGENPQDYLASLGLATI